MSGQSGEDDGKIAGGGSGDGDAPPATPADEAASDASGSGTVDVSAVPVGAEDANFGVAEPVFLHPDTSPVTSSQRFLRLIPPDSRPAKWWIRHRDRIMLVELVLTGIFFLLALYFLYLWITHEPPVAYAPDREGFLAALTARPPLPADKAWALASEPGRWKSIVVHHTATETGSVESIDRHHREVRGWENGLGYHFLIGNGSGMDDGETRPGGRWLKQLDGAHVRVKGTDKGNSYSIGVALVGNFENRVPTSRQLSSLRGLLSFLMREYGIEAAQVFGHGEVAEKHTACPGGLFFLDEVMKVL